ncbi:MAG: T9SS type A sorting domain-containing protein [Tannerella sp.]|nr:T9SS type A sorting domain-containing protein [Tannerella sp.]
MKTKRFFLAFTFAVLTGLQAGAHGSILTRTYYLNDFSGATANDTNGAWSSNGAMPGAISQAGGSLLVDLANTSDYGTLILTLNTPIDLSADSRVSLEWRFDDVVFTGSAGTNPELSLAVYLADAGSYENGHSKASNPALKTIQGQWTAGTCDPLHYSSGGAVDDQPAFVCNPATVKYIKIAYLQNSGGKILSGALRIRRLEIGKRPLIEHDKATRALLTDNTYLNDCADIHDGTRQVFSDRYIFPNENGELDLWMGPAGLGADTRMFIDKLAAPIDLSNPADRVFVLKGRATAVSPTDGRTLGIHLYTRPLNEGLGIYMNMPDDKKLRLKGPVLTVNNHAAFEITVDLDNPDNYQDGAAGKGAAFDWSRIGAWGLYTRPNGNILADAHIYIDEVRIGAERIPLNLELDSYTPASGALAVTVTPPATASTVLTNAETGLTLPVTTFNADGAIWNFAAPFESGNHYTLAVSDPVCYAPNPLTFTDGGPSTAVTVTPLSFDDSSLKIRLSRLIDLSAADFTLYNVTAGSTVAIASIARRGEEYTLEADLPAGADYTLTIAKDGYYFGAPLAVNKRGGTTPGEPIDREALVKRHTVRLDRLSADELPQVGNGEIGFSIDATGLQTFYGNSMSHWSWHTLPCPPELYAGFDRPHDALTLKQYDYNGRQLGLRTTSSGQTQLYNWMRENPHRFNLGRLRFLLSKEDGTQINASDVKNINQTLDLWQGIITSRYTIEGVPVDVETGVDPASGALAVRVRSPLITGERLRIEWAFPYGHHGNSGADWTNPGKHSSTLTVNDNRLEVARQMDDTRYHAVLAYESPAELSEPAAHTFVLKPGKQSDTFAFTVLYSPEYTGNVPAADDAFAASEEGWETFWRSGGAIDLSESSDVRWQELERRIVLSQYLIAINSSGSLPPQESGLFSNTGEWNGKFHLEMHWWHEAHYALWGRFHLFEPSLQYYRDALPKAKELAHSQGFKGARFVKMSGPDTEDAPSGIGPLIIWQQPHPIFYAELEYRLHPSHEVLEKWQDVIQETADFMADFAYYDQATDRYVLGPPVATVPENNNFSTTRNPLFELSYWHTGLRWAQTWRQRLGLERDAHWDVVMEKLSSLPVQDGLYLQQEGMSNTYTAMNWEHPSLIGPGGMLPYGRADRETVKRTVAKVWDVWQWDRCWGWDFPMMAMAAARNGRQSIAIDALLHPSTKNAMNRVGLSSGGPYPYFPANGGLLYAVALMAAGWDGAPDIPAPGFPNDGVSWKVRYEGLTRAPESFGTVTTIPPVAVSGSGVRVYPNPARQTLRIESDLPVRGVQVFNLQGMNVANAGSVSKEVDVSALPDGFYQVKIETERSVAVKKVMIRNTK